MTSSKMTRGFGAFSTLTLAGAAVLVFHSAALAQQAEPVAKDSENAQAEPVAEPAAEPTGEPEAQAQPPQDLPPEYGPPPGYRQPPPAQGYPPPEYGPSYNDYYGPRGYPPPPRRYYRPRYHQQPIRYYPEPITYRTFFFGLGLGVGGVALFPPSGNGDASSRPGISYNLHFGFGVSPRWSIVLSGDGAYCYFTGFAVDQSVWSIGPQVFITRHLYARGGIGVATKSIDYNTNSLDYYAYDSYSDSGMGWTAALGFEFLQSYHTSLGLELAGTFGHYQAADLYTYSKNQGTIGVNFMLNLF